MTKSSNIHHSNHKIEQPGTHTTTKVTRKPLVGPNGEDLGEEILEETITETITETVENVTDHHPVRNASGLNHQHADSRPTHTKTSFTNDSHIKPHGPSTKTRVIRNPIIGPNGEDLGEEIIEETITETVTESFEQHSEPTTKQRLIPTGSSSTSTKTSVQKSSSTVVGENVKPGTNTKTNVIRRPIIGPNGEEGEEIIEETITETITETIEEVGDNVGHKVSKPKADANSF